MNKTNKWRPSDSEISSLKQLFEQELFENVIPFWQNNSPDFKDGGYYNCLSQNGSVYDTTKHVWLQGRQAWMFSKLYNQQNHRPEWMQGTLPRFDLNYSAILEFLIVV